jgi:hypothetical protein
MLMARVMASRNISSHSVIQSKAVVADAEVAADRVVEVAGVRVDLRVINQDVLESGTSAVRGSLVKMAGLPRLTRHRGL